MKENQDMELVYFWIEDYGILKDCDVNLSPKYHIEYKNDRLNIEQTREMDEYLVSKSIVNGVPVENNIVNITSIVGENGCGKTTVIEYMRDTLASVPEPVSKANYLFVCKVGKIETELVCYHSENLKFEIYTKCKIIDVEKQHKDKRYNYYKLWKETCFVLYSNAFGMTTYGMNRNSNIWCITLPGTIMKDLHSKYDLENKYRLERNQYDSVSEFIRSEIMRQMRFMIHYAEEDKEIINFPQPKKVYLVLNNKEYWTLAVARKCKEDKDFSEQFEKVTDGIDNILKNIKDFGELKKYIQNFIKNVLYGTLCERIMFLHEKDSKKKEMLDNVKMVNVEMGHKNTNWSCYVEEILFKIMPRKYKDILGFINEFISFYTDCNLSGDNYSKAEIDHSNGLREFSKIFNQYDNLHLFYPYFHIDCVGSTGEEAIRSLMGRLYYIKDREDGKIYSPPYTNNEVRIYNLILCIDEADLYLHPRWQQNFISTLMDFIGKYYEECKVQIILTTHSPIMLSDMPSGHVIRMKDGKIVNKKESSTFGKNIYDLFSDEFFLEETDIGVIGRYANSWQQYIRDQLKEIETLIKDEKQGADVPKNSYYVDNCNMDIGQRLQELGTILDSCGSNFFFDMYKEKYKELCEDYKRHGEKENYSKSTVDSVVNDYNHLSDDEKERLLEKLNLERRKK